MSDNNYNLDEQLERSVEWVKYAETKNAVAIGLIGAAFVEICNSDKWNTVCGRILVATLAIQLLFLVFSFIPRFSSPLIIKKKKDELNFHYYGDVSSVSLFEYQTKLKNAYPMLDETSKYFKDVTHQIHINCEIAMIKFWFFKWVCFLTLVSGVSYILNAFFAL